MSYYIIGDVLPSLTAQSRQRRFSTESGIEAPHNCYYILYIIYRPLLNLSLSPLTRKDIEVTVDTLDFN